MIHVTCDKCGNNIEGELSTYICVRNTFTPQGPEKREVKMHFCPKCTDLILKVADEKPKDK